MASVPSVAHSLFASIVSTSQFPWSIALNVKVGVGVFIEEQPTIAVIRTAMQINAGLIRFLIKDLEQPNGMRYPRVGGTRQRRFAGTSLKPHELSENAATPTRRVHAVLGAIPRSESNL